MLLPALGAGTSARPRRHILRGGADAILLQMTDVEVCPWWAWIFTLLHRYMRHAAFVLCCRVWRSFDKVTDFAAA